MQSGMSKQYLQTNSISTPRSSDVFSLAAGPTYLFAATGSADVLVFKKTASTSIHDDDTSTGDAYVLSQTLEKAHNLGCHHVCVADEGQLACSVGFAGDVVVWKLDEEGWTKNGSIASGYRS